MTEVKTKSRTKSKLKSRNNVDPLFIGEEVPVKRNEFNFTRKPSNLTMQIIASPLSSPTAASRSNDLGADVKLNARQKGLEEDNCRQLLYQIIAENKEISEGTSAENSSSWLLYQTIMLLVGDDRDADSHTLNAAPLRQTKKLSPSGEDGAPRAAWLTPGVRGDLVAQCVERLNLSDAPTQVPLQWDMYGVDEDGDVMDDFPAIGPSVDLRTVGMRRFLLRRRCDQLPFLLFRLTPAAAASDTCTSPVDKAIEYINHLNQQLKEQCGPGGALGAADCIGASFDDDEFYSLSPATTSGVDRIGSSSCTGSAGRHTFSASPTCSASPFAGIGLGSPDLQLMPPCPIPTQSRWRSLSSSDAVQCTAMTAAPLRMGALPATEGNTRVATPTSLSKPPVFQFCVCASGQFFNDERITWHDVVVEWDSDRRRHALTHAKYGSTSSSRTSPCPSSCADSDSDGSVGTSSSAGSGTGSGSGSVSTFNSSVEATDNCEFDRACIEFSACAGLAGVGIADQGSHRPDCDGCSSGGESPDRGTWHDISSPSTSQKISTSATTDASPGPGGDSIARVDWGEFENERPPPAPTTLAPPSESLFASFKRMFL